MDLVPNGPRNIRLRALETLEERFAHLRVAVTEGNVAWDPKLLDLVDNETLFFESPERLAERVLEQCVHAKHT